MTKRDHKFLPPTTDETQPVEWRARRLLVSPTVGDIQTVDAFVRTHDYSQEDAIGARKDYLRYLRDRISALAGRAPSVSAHTLRALMLRLRAAADTYETAARAARAQSTKAPSPGTDTAATDSADAMIDWMQALKLLGLKSSTSVSTAHVGLRGHALARIQDAYGRAEQLAANRPRCAGTRGPFGEGEG